MKTMRFLVAMAILAAVGVGLTGSVSAAEKSGRKEAAKPVKKEKGMEKNAKSDTKLEVGKKNDVRKNGGVRKKSA